MAHTKAYSRIRMNKEIRLSFNPTDDDLKIIKNLEKTLGIGFPQLVRLGLRQLLAQQQKQSA